MLERTFDTAAPDAERERLIEIISAANESQTPDELAASCFEIFQRILPLHLGFLMLFAAPRVVLVNTREIPPELERALQTLQLPFPFFANLNQPDSHAALLPHIEPLMAQHKFEPPLLLPLRVGPATVGVMVLSGAVSDDGTPAWRALAARHDFLEQAGRHLGFAVQRYQQADELSEKRDELLRFLNGAQDGYWQTDGQGRVTLVNEAALRTLKRPREEVIGKRIDELSDADPEGLAELRKQLQSQGKVTDYMLKVRDREGAIHTIRETMRMSYDERGIPIKIHGIFRDITEELEAKQKIEDSNYELRLLHELATTLNNTLDRQGMLDASLELIMALTRADGIGIILINKDEGYYDLVAHRGLDERLVELYNRAPFDRAIYQPGFDAETTSNLVEYMVLTRRIMTMNEFRAMPRFNIQRLLDSGYQTLLAFPIVFDRTVYGIVLAGAKEAVVHAPHTLRMAESISAQLGLALQNQQLFAEAQLQVRQANTLMQTATMIQFAPTADAGLPLVVRAIRHALTATYISLVLLRGDHFQIVSASDEREARVTFPISPYEAEILKVEKPLIVRDAAIEEITPEHVKILGELKMRAVVGMRLYAHGRVSGILFVNQDEPREWTLNEVQLIQRFAQQIAYALENKRLLDEIQRQVNELHSLARAGRLIGTAPTPDDAMHDVAQEIARVFPADYVSFHMRDGEVMHLIAESLQTHAPRALAIQPHQRVILEELETTRVSDYSKDAVQTSQKKYLEQYELVADLGVPLLAGNKALGIMYLSQRQAHDWTPDEVRLAQTFATQITGVLVSARLLRESQIQVNELKALARSAHLISTSHSPDTALPPAAAELRRVLGADYVGFHFVEGTMLRAITESNNRWSDYKYPIEPYHRIVMDHNTKMVVHDRERDARDPAQLANMRQHDFAAMVGVPLLSRGNPLGILFVSHKKPRRWEPSELRLIETYAHQIAGVLDTVRLLNERTEWLQGLRQLATFTEIVVTMPDEDSITELALTLGKELMGADIASLALIQDDQILSVDNSAEIKYPIEPAELTDWMREVVDAKVPFVHDAEHPFVYDARTQKRVDFYRERAMLWVPMVTAHETIGLLNFAYRREHVFTDEEKSMAQTVANQLAMAFANARLVRAQKDRISSLTAHSDFSLWCGTNHESRTLQKQAIERVCRMLKATAGSIRLVENDYLTPGVAHGFRRPELRDERVPISPPLRQVITRKKPYLVNDIDKTPGVPQVWIKTHREEGFGALLMVPMIAEDKVLGILTLYHGEAHQWKAAEIQSAETLTNILALAISNTLQRETAEHKTDELEATLNSVFSGVFVTDAEGAIILWNKQAHLITGVTEEDMRGKHWETDGPKVGADKRADHLVMEAMTEDETRFSLAVREWKHPDGHPILLRLVATPLHDRGGKVRGAVVAFWDRNQEQAGERAKVDLINGLAHDLGNKLGPVLIASEQLLNTKLSEGRRKEYQKLIASWIKRLAAFHERLVMLQNERVQGEIQDEEFDLFAVVQEEVATFKAMNTGHKFQVRGDFDHVRADPFRVHSILENLLNNAVKYAAPHSRITITARCPLPGELELAIHNRGKHIPTDLQPQIFERGIRGDTSQPGSGLGLWLVQTKVQEIGGRIRVESSARKGTTFFVTLRRSEHALPESDANSTLPSGDKNRRKEGGAA